MFKKLDYRMHKEMDIANIVSTVRRNDNLSSAFFSPLQFDEPILKSVKEDNHTTIVDIDLES